MNSKLYCYKYLKILYKSSQNLLHYFVNCPNVCDSSAEILTVFIEVGGFYGAADGFNRHENMVFQIEVLST